MKLSIIVFLFIGFFMNISAQLPPLIDREIFFGDPEYSGAQISPDGKYITFIKPFNNVRNIWIKERNQRFEDARPITADTKRPISGYFWSRDGKYVLYVQDKGGDENYRVYAVDPKEKGNPVPEAKDLTPLPNVRAMIIDVPKNSPNEIIIGLNDRDPQLHDVYRINLKTGKRTLIWKNDDNVAGWITNLKGELKLGLRMLPDGGSEILKINGEKLEQIYAVNSEENASPIRFTKDGDKFYLISNKGISVDKSELYLYDLKTGKIDFVEKDPLDEVDFSDVIFSDITNEILATVYEGDRLRIYPKDKKFAKDLETLKAKLPEGELSLRSVTSDENLWIVGVSRDVDPGSVYLFDRKKGEVELLYKSRPNLPTEHLANMKPIRYKSKDGLEIPAYLTLPKGIESKNLPTILFVHGGPWARDNWGYDPMAQFLANRGYAVLQPNFRGSTGYGKKFLNAGNKEWGRGDMQHDLTAAVEWLIKEGIANPSKVGISGGSYGGYATLAGLAFTPDLYAAGFSIVGPSSIITLLNSIPPYWAPLKKMFDIRVGDMNNPEEKKILEEQSPLNYAKEIKAPLYVVQGANDPRVKKAESDQIVIALRELKRQVEYMVAPDEGHGFAGLENRLAMTVAMEKFFAKHLGGRVQEDIKPEIAKKLSDITVDINSVTLAKKEDTSTESLITSFDGTKIIPDISNYKMTYFVRGQEVPMDVVREIKKETIGNKEAILIIDKVSGMMSGTDSLFVDAKTLLPIERTIHQGPAKISLQFGEKSVTGKMISGAQEMPINYTAENSFVTDGSGLDFAIRSLDFSKTPKFKILQFNLMEATAKEVLVEYKGEEKVKINAGEFDVIIVDIKTVGVEDDLSTFRFEKNSRKLIKLDSMLPKQMGGGNMVMELQQK